jgi:hypothetical protein
MQNIIAPSLIGALACATLQGPVLMGCHTP